MAVRLGLYVSSILLSRTFIKLLCFSLFLDEPCPPLYCVKLLCLLSTLVVTLRECSESGRGI